MLTNNSIFTPRDLHARLTWAGRRSRRRDLIRGRSAICRSRLREVGVDEREGQPAGSREKVVKVAQAAASLVKPLVTHALDLEGTGEV